MPSISPSSIKDIDKDDKNRKEIVLEGKKEDWICLINIEKEKKDHKKKLKNIKKKLIETDYK